MLFLMAFSLVFSHVFSEMSLAEELGDAARTSVNTTLFEESSVSSKVIGRLPSGTTVRFKGEKASSLAKIEVELETGWVTGWLAESALDFEGNIPPEEKVQKISKKPPVGIPHDEINLVRREPTFLYGFYGGSNYGLVAPTLGGSYVGGGILIGARAGFYQNKYVVFEARMDYETIGGSDYASGFGSYTFGFFNILFVYTRRISPIELNFIGGVSFGLSVPDILPAGKNISSPADLTSPVVGLGAEKHFWLNELSQFHIGLQYRFHPLITPALVQSLVFNFGISIEG